MSGTVPPPPPGHDGRPPTVPPPAGVRRVASAYQRPSVVDPMAEVPLQQVTAPSVAAAPPAPTAHAPVPQPPDAAPNLPASPAPAYQPTQQIPPASYGQQPSYAPAPAAAAPTGSEPAYQAGYEPAYQAAPASVAATQVQQPVYAQPAPAQHAPGGTYPAGAAVPPPQPPRRRRLSAGWIAFIAVDVVLIALAAVFAVQILTSSSPNPPAAGADPITTPTPSVSASEDKPMQGAAVAQFAAPSKNITCTIYADGVSCGIAQLNQQPAPVEGCEGTVGYVATVDSDGQVELPCVPASQQPKTAGGGADVLDYGESRTEGDFTCTSEKTGMSCTHDPTGKGFSLARAGIGQR